MGSTVPTPGPSPTATPTPTPGTGECVRSSTRAHVSAGRAEERWTVAYAVGSGDRLGRVSSLVYASVRQTAPGTWTAVASC